MTNGKSLMADEAQNRIMCGYIRLYSDIFGYIRLYSVKQKIKLGSCELLHLFTFIHVVRNWPFSGFRIMVRKFPGCFRIGSDHLSSLVLALHSSKSSFPRGFRRRLNSAPRTAPRRLPGASSGSTNRIPKRTARPKRNSFGH